MGKFKLHDDILAKKADKLIATTKPGIYTSFTSICEICGKSRTIRGLHNRCSKIKQQRGIKAKERENGKTE